MEGKLKFYLKAISLIIIFSSIMVLVKQKDSFINLNNMYDSRAQQINSPTSVPMASPQVPPAYVTEVAGTNVYTPQSSYVNQYYAYTPSSGSTRGTTAGTTTTGGSFDRTATTGTATTGTATTGTATTGTATTGTATTGTAATGTATTGTAATAATTSPAIISAAAASAAKIQISTAPTEDSTNTVIYVVAAIAVVGIIGGGAYLVMLNRKF
jgi:hypothetical protein